MRCSPSPRSPHCAIDARVNSRLRHSVSSGAHGAPRSPSTPDCRNRSKAATSTSSASLTRCRSRRPDGDPRDIPHRARIARRRRRRPSRRHPRRVVRRRPGTLDACSRWQLHVRLKRPRGLVNPGGFDAERFALERGIVATGYVRDDGSEPRAIGEAPFCVDGLRDRLADEIDRRISGAARRRARPRLRDRRHARPRRRRLGSRARQRHPASDRDLRIPRRRRRPGSARCSCGSSAGCSRGLALRMPIAVVAVPAALATRHLLRRACRRQPADCAHAADDRGRRARACSAGARAAARRRCRSRVVAILARRSARRAVAGVLAFVRRRRVPDAVPDARPRRRARLLARADARPARDVARTAAADGLVLRRGVARRRAFESRRGAVRQLRDRAALSRRAARAADRAAARDAAAASGGVLRACAMDTARTHRRIGPARTSICPSPGSSRSCSRCSARSGCSRRAAFRRACRHSFCSCRCCVPSRDPIEAGAFEAVFIDVGQGLSVLVRTREHALLYDAGARYPSEFDLGKAAVLPTLHALGVSMLDRHRRQPRRQRSRRRRAGRRARVSGCRSHRRRAASRRSRDCASASPANRGTGTACISA